MPQIFSVKQLCLTLVVLCLANTLLYAAVFASPKTEVVVQKAGKGTIALLHSEGKWVLLNTGSDGSILRAIGTTLPPWTRTLALVMLLDSSAINAGGAPEVLERYQIDTLMRLGTTDTSSRGTTIARLLQEGRVREISRIPYGTHLTLGGLTIVLLGPGAAFIQNQNKTLVVSSTTSVGTYRF